MDEFGRRLDEARNNAAMTQDELAKKLGYSKGSISKWINGGAYPPLVTLIKMCGLLDCSADWLLGLRVSQGNASQHAGIEWDEQIPQNISQMQRETIELGIALFRSLVVEDLNVNEITSPHGRFANESWSTLNQAFMVAVQSGALKITKIPRDFELEDTVNEYFKKMGINLRNIIVAKIEENSNHHYSVDGAIVRVELVAFLGAREALIRSKLRGKVVGIGGGYTLLRLAEQSIATLDEFGNTEWVGMQAAEDPALENPVLSPHFVTALLASKHRGSKALPFPFIPTEKRDRLQVGLQNQTFNEKCAAEALAKLENAAAAFFTVSGTNLGYPAASIDLAPKLLQGMYRDLERRGLLDEFGGVILGWMLNESGQPLGPNELQKVVFTPSLKILEKISIFGESWIVAAKKYKAKAIKMAIKKGLANSLVIDSEIAQHLVTSPD